jgi:hypothetical protein
MPTPSQWDRLPRCERVLTSESTAIGQDGLVETAVGILLLVISVLSVVVVLAAFVWAARKDGEKDRATQRRLGIRRRTRLGR